MVSSSYPAARIFSSAALRARSLIEPSLCPALRHTETAIALISPTALAELLSTRRFALLDVRWALGSGANRDDYARSHIPGAAFVDLDAELSSEPGPRGRHPLPAADAFGQAMRRAGVRRDAPVIAYDARTSMAAARAWWLLRYFGHPDVRVLDGGLSAWSEAGQAVEVGAPAIPAGDWEPRPGHMPLLDARGASWIADHGVLLDARAAERFSGAHEPIDPVAGHIPGARNHPATLNLDASGRFRNRRALREEFARLGIRDGTPAGAYCGSGVTAAHEVLALELAGHPAALYAGSWSEWIIDPHRPVATGATTA
jgi:thiosulfate/3-mercaptopyruvate sulfurtransferase